VSVTDDHRAAANASPEKSWPGMERAAGARAAADQQRSRSCSLSMRYAGSRCRFS